MAPGRSAWEVVVGASTPDDTVAFLGVFDLVTSESVEIGRDAATGLFGLPGAVTATRLVPRLGVPRPSVLVVPTPAAPAPSVAYDRGPRALDIYTADLDRTMSLASAAGFDVSPVGALSAGPMTMSQAMIDGPDGFAVVAVQTTHRRSSLLDDEPDALHSGPHSVVWVVADQAAERNAFDSFGLTVSAPITFSEPSISDELSLPDRPTPIEMCMVSDQDVSAVRLELMTFEDHISTTDATAPRRPDVSPGIWALRYPMAGSSFPVSSTEGEVHAFEGDDVCVVTTAGGIRLMIDRAAER